MWRRQLWTDAKPVAIMKEACLADNEKVVVGGVRFFLGSDQEREEDEASDEEVSAQESRASLRWSIPRLVFSFDLVSHALTFAVPDARHQESETPASNQQEDQKTEESPGQGC